MQTPGSLRIGNNHYASRLAEIIEGLLNARPTATDKADMKFTTKNIMPK
jgi:hypothetical protein